MAASDARTFDKIPGLENVYRRGIRQRHRIFEVEITLRDVFTRLVLLLDNSYIQELMRCENWKFRKSAHLRLWKPERVFSSFGPQNSG
jgi:hypothetical protein